MCKDRWSMDRQMSRTSFHVPCESSSTGAVICSLPQAVRLIGRAAQRIFVPHVPRVPAKPRHGICWRCAASIRMVNTQEARPARRPQGSLSARQWQELRQAARLARSEGVVVTRYGFTFSPALRSNNQVRGSEPAAREAAGEPRSSSTRQPSPRDVQRAQEFRARVRVQQRWLPLVLKLVRSHRWTTQQAVWTSWLRARLSPPKPEVLRKLRDLLWRAWTTPQFGSSSDSQDLSLRTKYMRVRFDDACSLMRMQIALAIEAQEAILCMCPDSGRSLPARGAAEAGITTPVSARKQGKKPRGRGRGA
jgi:hypothetical protein